MLFFFLFNKNYERYVTESQTLFLHQLEAFLNEVSFYFFLTYFSTKVNK